MNVDTASSGAQVRRRPRRDEVRAGILDAAEVEFLRQGYSAANLEAITNRAGFTKGALYSNFESKSELFVSLIEERFDRVLREQVIGVPTGSGGEQDPERRINTLAKRLCALTFQDEAWHVLIIELAILATHDTAAASVYLRSRDIVRRRIELAVEKIFGSASGSEGNVRTELVSLMVILLTNVIALDGSIDRGRFTPQVRTQMFEVALRGAVDARPSA